MVLLFEAVDSGDCEALPSQESFKSFILIPCLLGLSVVIWHVELLLVEHSGLSRLETVLNPGSLVQTLLLACLLTASLEEFLNFRVHI